MTDLIRCRCRSCEWSGSLSTSCDAICPACGDEAERAENKTVSKKKPITAALPEWLSPTQAAAIKGCTVQGIYSAIKAGRLRARKIGGRLVLHRVTVSSWEYQAGRGRPRKEREDGEG